MGRWGAAACRQGGGDDQGAAGGGERREHHAEGGGEGGNRAQETSQSPLAAALLGGGEDQRHEACRQLRWHYGGRASLEGRDQALQGGGFGCAGGAGVQVCLEGGREGRTKGATIKEGGFERCTGASAFFHELIRRLPLKNDSKNVKKV